MKFGETLSRDKVVSLVEGKNSGDAIVILKSNGFGQDYHDYPLSRWSRKGEEIWMILQHNRAHVETTLVTV